MQVKIGRNTRGHFVVLETCKAEGAVIHAGQYVFIDVMDTRNVFVRKTLSSVPLRFKLEELKDLKIRELYKNEPNKFFTQSYR